MGMSTGGFKWPPLFPRYERWLRSICHGIYISQAGKSTNTCGILMYFAQVSRKKHILVPCAWRHSPLRMRILFEHHLRCRYQCWASSEPKQFIPEAPIDGEFPTFLFGFGQFSVESRSSNVLVENRIYHVYLRLSQNMGPQNPRVHHRFLQRKVQCCRIPHSRQVQLSYSIIWLSIYIYIYIYIKLINTYIYIYNDMYVTHGIAGGCLKSIEKWVPYLIPLVYLHVHHKRGHE